MLRLFGILLFGAGLAFGIRVMFFGVQRKVGDDRLVLRRWPLALAGVLLLTGFLFYVQAKSNGEVTTLWFGLVALVAVGAALAAWLFVKRSADVPSSDPEDDPKFRLQGHVARIVESIEPRGSQEPTGRIAFDFENRSHVMIAKWSPGSDALAGREVAPVGEEVVIEFVEADVAFVEPWAVVEKRL
jgi:hypothetical protein